MNKVASTDVIIGVDTHKEIHAAFAYRRIATRPDHHTTASAKASPACDRPPLAGAGRRDLMRRSWRPSPSSKRPNLSRLMGWPQAHWTCPGKVESSR